MRIAQAVLELGPAGLTPVGSVPSVHDEVRSSNA
jgi:hypothetical protein